VLRSEPLGDLQRVEVPLLRLAVPSLPQRLLPGLQMPLPRRAPICLLVGLLAHSSTSRIRHSTTALHDSVAPAGRVLVSPAPDRELYLLGANLDPSYLVPPAVEGLPECGSIPHVGGVRPDMRNASALRQASRAVARPV